MVHKAAASQAALPEGPQPPPSHSPWLHVLAPCHIPPGPSDLQGSRRAIIRGRLSPRRPQPPPRQPTPLCPALRHSYLAQRGWLLVPQPSLFLEVPWPLPGPAGGLGIKMPPSTTTPGHHPGETSPEPPLLPPLPACLSECPFSQLQCSSSDSSRLPKPGILTLFQFLVCCQ